MRPGQDAERQHRQEGERPDPERDQADEIHRGGGHTARERAAERSFRLLGDRRRVGRRRHRPVGPAQRFDRLQVVLHLDGRAVAKSGDALRGFDHEREGRGSPLVEDRQRQCRRLSAGNAHGRRGDGRDLRPADPQELDRSPSPGVEPRTLRVERHRVPALGPLRGLPTSDGEQSGGRRVARQTLHDVAVRPERPHRVEPGVGPPPQAEHHDHERHDHRKRDQGRDPQPQLTSATEHLQSGDRDREQRDEEEPPQRARPSTRNHGSHPGIADAHRQRPVSGVTVHRSRHPARRWCGMST